MIARWLNVHIFDTAVIFVVVIIFMQKRKDKRILEENKNFLGILGSVFV